VLIALLAGGCEPVATPFEFSGHTQGTTYSIRGFCRTAQPTLQPDVDRLLDDVVATMSTYEPTSTLSTFNALPPGGWYEVPSVMAQIVVAARQLAQISDGAFDVTVGALVNAWGFGPAGGTRDAVPSSQALDEARSRVGYRYLDVRFAPPGLRKRRDVYVDLSAIAQGYTADAMGELLDRRGCPSYMVEIGGEVRVGARKPDGQRWRIAIDSPDHDTRSAPVLLLENGGVSTSGDYRDYFEVAGRRYSHTMDPRAGKPVEHDLASVSVIAPSAMWADGIATLLNVLGPTDGLAFATTHGIAARFVQRTPNGFVERRTPAFGAAVNTDRR
jgi:thiamine biosynthesis lipoprotein